jgi:hypothetical protein
LTQDVTIYDTQSEAAMGKALALTDRLASALQTVVGTGDLSKLTAAERVEYYGAACRSLGLNPFTRPFQFISLQGKVVMYATKDATDQIRSLNSISIESPQITFTDGMVVVTVTGRAPNGRTDTEIGAVALTENIKGEARANAMMKAITKAKRRLTLSLCGLGMLDESEIDDISGAQVLEMDDAGTIRHPGASPAFDSLKSARDNEPKAETAPARTRKPKANENEVLYPAAEPATVRTPQSPTGRNRMAEPVAEVPITVSPETPVVESNVVESVAEELADDLPFDDEPTLPNRKPGEPRKFADGEAFVEAIITLVRDTNEHKDEIEPPLLRSVKFDDVAQILNIERSRKALIAFYDRFKCDESQIWHLRTELIRRASGQDGDELE